MPSLKRIIVSLGIYKIEKESKSGVISITPPIDKARDSS